MNLSAYGSEIVRSAVRNVDSGQWEAAVALNLSPATTMRRIILVLIANQIRTYW